MSCHNFIKKIILYLYEELSDQERAKLKWHLKECANCRLELERLRETQETFREVKIVGPSPFCEAAVQRLAREHLTLRNSWINRVERFLKRLAPRMPRPVSAALGLLVLLLALALYISHEQAPFPFREERRGEIAPWENGIEDSLELLAAEVKELKEGEDLLSLLTIDAIEEKTSLDEELANLERDIFYLSGELNAI